jgi:hypothetical protein
VNNNSLSTVHCRIEEIGRGKVSEVKEKEEGRGERGKGFLTWRWC